ncbi:F-box/kelch-repeat protein [Trifolium repens]|nr:F-box/kelch-repeat protein [Trifolium repens]
MFSRNKPHNLPAKISTTSTVSSHSPMDKTTAVMRLSDDSLHRPPSLTYLPFDVIVEILCRLPVKFLLQLCCVCKSWNSLILKDHKFANKHLHLSNKRHHLMITSRNISKGLAIISYPLDSVPLHSILTSKGTRLDYSSIITSHRDGRLIGSCDGLLCFHVYKLTFLYNPCIRKVKELPSLEIPPKNCPIIYAFGYDPCIDNYKAIAVFCYFDKLLNPC